MDCPETEAAVLWSKQQTKARLRRYLLLQTSRTQRPLHDRPRSDEAFVEKAVTEA